LTTVCGRPNIADPEEQKHYIGAIRATIFCASVTAE
jgi:hypothetical protein